VAFLPMQLLQLKATVSFLISEVELSGSSQLLLLQFFVGGRLQVQLSQLRQGVLTSAAVVSCLHPILLQLQSILQLLQFWLSSKHPLLLHLAAPTFALVHLLQLPGQLLKQLMLLLMLQGQIPLSQLSFPNFLLLSGRSV